MIKISFFVVNSVLIGYEISGHSGYKKAGEDIICASVSSAAYMICNTITDILLIDAEVEIRDGFMSVILTRNDAITAQIVLEGLKLHMVELQKDYSDFIIVNVLEV